MRKYIICAASLIAFLSANGKVSAMSESEYKSPYKIAFTVPYADLAQVDSAPPRNDVKLESNVPYEEWYSRRVRKEDGSWGPRARQFPAFPNFEKLPIEFKRQRLLFTAEKWTGRPYQHHHIPDWDPPADWPWKEVAYGRNSAGIDCSDFTSWVYNYGLGIKLRTGIGEQAELTEVKGPGGEGSLRCRTINNDNGYDSLVKTLRTGDLLYIKKSPQGKVSHVIMWVGEYGKNPDGIPLIIDSTGTGHKDSNGVDIPVGVHLRPFSKDSWYFRCFSHAHRILDAD